jgi:hypothetical protein
VLSTLPNDLQRNFALIKELDAVIKGIKFRFFIIIMLIYINIDTMDNLKLEFNSMTKHFEVLPIEEFKKETKGSFDF